MARALWSGFISFGLVSVPVGLYRATEDQTVHFNQLHSGTSNRIRYKKVDEATGEEVAATDIVNGFDLGDGEYVIVTRDELKDAAPGRSELIEISDFVDLAAIDPIYFRQSYYLAPKGKGADRAYALLRQAMQDTRKVGIATLVLRDKQHLVAIRPGEDVLVLETMYFPAEIRSASEELESLPRDIALNGRELEVAKTLVDALTVDWQPQRYENTYRAKVEQLIESKREGRITVASPSSPETNVVDLMSALEASVARTATPRSSRGSDTGDTLPAPRRLTARPGGKAAPKAKAKTARRSSATSFDMLTKTDLQSLAADYQVPKRSSMSKAQLVAALTDLGATPDHRRRPASASA
jgi:DNA end-binding protein Ku